MRLLRPFTFVLALLLGGAAFAATGEAAAPQVVSSQFGLFNVTESGKPVFLRASIVPLLPGQTYGWIIKLRGEKGKIKGRIKWREEFTLPAKPDIWGVSQTTGTHLSADGRTMTMERTVTPRNGIILNSWDVAPGDPEGRHVIHVYIEDQLAATFDFYVR
jgi:hypothetical protein